MATSASPTLSPGRQPYQYRDGSSVGESCLPQMDPNYSTLYEGQVQSLLWQACPGLCGGWRAGEGGSLLIPCLQYQSSLTHLSHNHNIILVQLWSLVQLMSHIHVLPLSHSDCLPSSTCCQVSGSSTITSPQVSYSQTLQCANIQLCSDEEFHHVYLRKITPNLLCAGTKEGGKESCEADFDGPLTCDGMLCGIFSYRDFSFEQPKRPDVYT